MTAYRVLPLVAMLVAVPFAAGAQFGMPGVPGVCSEILALRAAIHRHGQTMQRATERRAPVEEVCRLLGARLAVETRLLKLLEEHGGACGTPADELKLVKERHAWALWIGNFCGKSGDMRLPGEGFYRR